MELELSKTTPAELAAQIDAEIQALPDQYTASTRRLRQEYSRQLKNADPAYVHELAFHLIHQTPLRWIAYELLAGHRPAFASLGEVEIVALGQGIDSWHAVDGFARSISGPAWLRGQVSDDLIHRWARSDDLWWRRTALVSTVALNMRSHGGTGDTPRTLVVCRMLVDDHTDMVVKALSWALRELVVHDPQAVRAFLAEHAEMVAARVRREVRNKLETGLKNPRQG